ncbi:hypothetical protein D3OALGA1CA_3931 [Olavius algarvensis associated proteobacterium Delta 3]|nr:hypothetical protein D3OALGB2SA_2121 [Olavius algarvensis associated proteobacterium Delta 3]CAB5142416.1 hypothetical protein D3OALGA1CA_3931 [Olavius algarvensis associated proteobacterium Delta 3]
MAPQDRQEGLSEFRLFQKDCIFRILWRNSGMLGMGNYGSAKVPP